MLAIIGGSGLTRLPELTITHREIIRTPYGLPSSPLLIGTLGTKEIVFLARHGLNHTHAPHTINYRANIWALHHIGANSIIAISSASTLSSRCPAGALLVPHDLIDYTSGRTTTFHQSNDQPVVYTDFTYPYDEGLRQQLINHANTHNQSLIDNGVYACINGPRLPTQAEMCRYAHDGADVYGMTGMPEAVLARELQLPYAHLCGIMNTHCTTNTQDCNEQRHHQTHQAIENIRRLLINL